MPPAFSCVFLVSRAAKRPAKRMRHTQRARDTTHTPIQRESQKGRKTHTHKYVRTHSHVQAHGKYKSILVTLVLVCVLCVCVCVCVAVCVCVFVALVLMLHVCVSSEAAHELMPASCSSYAHMLSARMSSEAPLLLMPAVCIATQASRQYVCVACCSRHTTDNMCASVRSCYTLDWRPLA